jgi:hypothetical protein
VPSTSCGEIPGLPLTRLESNPPMRQGKHFDVDELRKHFQENLRRTAGGLGG